MEPLESFLGMQRLGLCKASTVPARLPSPTVTLNVGSGRQLRGRGSLAKQRTFLLFVCLFFRLLSANAYGAGDSARS